MQVLPAPQAQIGWNATPNARLIAIKDEPIDLDLEDGSEDHPYELD
jgi:hypothetical protein